MSKRTMIKLSAFEDYIYLRTLSKKYHSPQGFTITDKELAKMEDKGYKVISDIHSFAKLSLRKTMDETDILVIKFTWLSDAGGGKVSGREETVLLSYEKFQEYVWESRKNNGEQKRILSLDEKPIPRIEFQSRRNLKAVTGEKLLPGTDAIRNRNLRRNHSSWAGKYGESVLWDTYLTRTGRIGFTGQNAGRAAGYGACPVFFLFC